MSSIRRYALAALASAVFAGSAVAKDYELLNVSYDPTRELYQDYNAEFTSYWKQSHPGDSVKIQQSHGGSGKQGRAVCFKPDFSYAMLAHSPFANYSLSTRRRTARGNSHWLLLEPTHTGGRAC